MKIITGMHRSGTSLVAQIFHLVEAPMGDPATFYPADKWNPDGYFEQREALELNMRLVNGPWGRFSYFRLPGERTIERRGRKLEGELKAAAKRFEGCVVKDARFCLTLAAWRSAGASVPALVICLRHPYHVALSLKRRNKISIPLGIKLWHQHNARLETVAGDERRCYVRYDHLLNPEKQAFEVRRALEVCGVEAGESELAKALGEAIKVDFNHFRHRPPAEVKLPPQTAELWERLLAKHGAQG